MRTLNSVANLNNRTNALYYFFSYSGLLCLLVTVLTYSSLAKAEFNFGGDFGIVQDNNSISTNSLNQKSFYNFNLYAKAINSINLFLGAEYLNLLSQQPKDDLTTDNLVASNVLLGAKVQFGEGGLYALTLAGSPMVQATYKVSGLNSEKWTGSAWLARLSLQPIIYNHIRLVATINYYSASYNSKNQSTSTLVSQTAFNRSLLIPSVGLSFFF